ncbi:MAG: RsmB/NOP family class I SAM-dependent RNA methyltransferase [Christensenellales bacterium]
MEKKYHDNLPSRFLANMKLLLGEQYPSFEESLDDEPRQSLRVNTLKLSPKRAEELLGGNLQPVDWCDSGYYYNDYLRPGKHPYHEAGLYYIQEASAMSVVEALGVQEGDVVLDLCSAPGGKATHIACKLGDTGLLIANEIVPSRAKILSQNIERMGIARAIVTNNSPDELQDRWQEFFDKIVVDAPCSGEGMFRKNPQAVAEWNEQSPAICAQRQALILDSAYKMLKKGGKMIYSTCTFEVEENERTIERFLDRHGDMSIVEPCVRFDDCKVDNTEKGYDSIAMAQRVFPHRYKGEGHFFCVMQKAGMSDSAASEKPVKVPAAMIKIFDKWQKENLNVTLSPNVVFGDNLYYLPHPSPNLKGVRVLRCGLHLGEIKKDRFEPSHSLAMHLSAKDAKRIIDTAESDGLVEKYYVGETLECDFRGWGLVCVDGYPCGWCKGDGVQAKNHYPKGLRKDIKC